MLVDVIMPKLGPNMLEGLLIRWLKQEGEPIRKDEDLAEIETEKVNAVIAAPADGTLAEILIQAGAEAQVGAVVARIRIG